ncbi:DNA topoisomerase 4 subunit A OS=Lysinibacillus sphaericus OX=1421 GN=parC PE=3 SV=1 [Lysinibacillus sphaericus]
MIELKKDVPAQGILNYLFKTTDLQVAYNFNMIAIHNRRPTMMTLPLLLDAYIAHQKEVVTNRSIYDLQKAKDRSHIVDGLIKALSILDEVIATIRSSNDKRDAKTNLQVKFDFTEVQSEAIVSLQLYRLTNTDITELRREQDELNALIAKLEGILHSGAKLVRVIKQELLDIKKRFSEPRRSKIEQEIEEIKITLDVLVPSEDVVVTVTKDGYIKRTSTRSHAASNGQDFAMKDSDYLLYEATLNTQHHLLLFTNRGNYIYQPVHELPDIRWKDLGQHISSIVPTGEDETIIAVYGFDSFEQPNIYILTATKEGQIKRSPLPDYAVTRYSKPIKTMNVKSGDEMIMADIVSDEAELLLITDTAYAIRFPIEELPVTGVKTGGVKGITLKDGEVLVGVTILKPSDTEYVVIVTQRGAVKKMNVAEVDMASRAKRGLKVLTELKANPHRIVAVVKASDQEQVIVETEKGVKEIIDVKGLTRADRHSNGSFKIDIATDGTISHVMKMKKEEE